MSDEFNSPDTLPTLNFSSFQPVGVAWDRDREDGPYFPGMLVNSTGNSEDPPEALVLVAWPLFQTPAWVQKLSEDPMTAPAEGRNEDGSEDFEAMAARKLALQVEGSQWCAEAAMSAVKQGGLLIPFYFADPAPGTERSMFSGDPNAVFKAMREAGSNPLVQIMLDGEPADSVDLATLIYGEVYLSGAFEAAALTAALDPNGGWSKWLDEQRASVEG